ncbi:protein translocase subunit SecD [Cellvibrio sp. PSBB023]|uniref:protein translocase subunit SecD n=1 Tax=Cellvibrio sp. PSBB023 TaxID=1945512 RepID=UPI00098FB083|nr:protein translocase subunit SecD [Cellvibrio sp. PSBB023]AQT60664.1 protein translocase subunit SecDF [Cellvibrio sp. PSBB023]
MKTLFSRAIVYGLIILFGLLSALPNLLPDSALAKLPDWYAKNQLTLGLDLRGGSHLLLEVDTSELVRNKNPALHEQIVRDAVEQSLQVVRRRLDETGMVEPMITRQGRDSILVQLPGVSDPQHIRDLLGTTARMTFHWAANNQSPLHTKVITVNGEAGERYQLEERVAMEGKHISDARLAFNHDTGEPVVNFKLDNEGARRFGDMTKRNVGRVLAIVLDDKVVTAPVIRSAIQGGSGEISGSFTSASANDLALLLRAGALPAPLKVIEERTVGPDLGSDAISMGISTGIVGALLVLAFMVGIYGRWGFIACIGLAINIGLSFGVLSLLGATLTLPGIAGFILSIGMAVDANILINERIREETRRGQPAMAALSGGFQRAYSTILDSNVTSLIAISLLFLFGSGPVRGFAVTMAVGLIISMFTAISFTRLVMEWRVRKLGKQSLIISGIKWLDSISENTIPFLRARFFGLMASAVLSLASVFLFFSPGLDYGIDFSGGTVIEVQAPDTNVAALRKGLADEGKGQVAIQEFGNDGHYLLRLPMPSAEDIANGTSVQAVKSAVTAIAPDAAFPRVEMVGPRVSGDFGDATILAIILAGLGMLGYLWVRFESHFALAATLTLALDLTKTIGFFALAGVEFNLTAVAALLALIGYSVNDKVVVFDRIRENLRLTPDKPLVQLLNESITSTLTRTIFTSITTFLAILPMAIAGGSAVSSFSLPMLFGIVIGTSSSILIATPIVMLLGERRVRKGKSQLHVSADPKQREIDLLP